MAKNSKSVLLEAEGLVNGPRAKAYDSPEKNFERIAAIAKVLIRRHITPSECVMVLIAVKLARESHMHKRDNIVDACGYLEILERVLAWESKIVKNLLDKKHSKRYNLIKHRRSR